MYATEKGYKIQILIFAKIIDFNRKLKSAPLPYTLSCQKCYKNTPFY